MSIRTHADGARNAPELTLINHGLRDARMWCRLKLRVNDEPRCPDVPRLTRSEALFGLGTSLLNADDILVRFMFFYLALEEWEHIQSLPNKSLV